MIFAEQRSDTTQFELGQMFSETREDKRDYEQAAGWFKRSARQGNSKAQYKLGLMYSRGVGVRRNPVKAYAWLKIAATQGSNKALHLLKRLANKIPSEQLGQAHRMSRNYYEKYVVPFSH